MLRSYRFIVALSLTTGFCTTMAQPVAPDSTAKLHNLPSVLVSTQTEERIRIPGSAHRIDSDRLEKQDYTDIHRILAEVPGVTTFDEEGYGNRPHISIRGSGQERSSKVNLMEDGVLIAPAPYSAPAAYIFPSMGRISAVEVRKGSSQVAFGPRSTGGAINFTSTPIPAEFSGKTELVLGQNDYRQMHTWAGTAGEWYGILAEGYTQSTSGFKTIDGYESQSTGFNKKDFMLKARLQTPANFKIYQELEAKWLLTDDVSDESYLGLTAADFEQNPYRRYAGSAADKLTAGLTQHMLRYLIIPTQNLELSVILYQNDFARNWYKLDKVGKTGISAITSNPQAHLSAYNTLNGATGNTLDVKANNRIYLSQGIQTQVNYNWGGEELSHKVEVGVRYHQDSEDRHQWVDVYTMNAGKLALQTPGIAGTDANRIASAKAWSSWIQYTLSAGNLTVVPGLRGEWVDFTREDWGKADPDRVQDPTKKTNSAKVEGLSDLIWGVGVNYLLNPQWSIFGGAHKGFDPPGPGASDSVRAETSIALELGSRIETSKIQTSLTAFATLYQNLLGKETAAGGGTSSNELYNGGKVNIFGVEFGARSNVSAFYDLPIGIPFWLNYTHSYGTFESSFESSYKPWKSVNKGDELPFLPRHQFAASAGLEHNAGFIDLTLNYVSATRYKAGKGSIPVSERIGYYGTADLSAGLHLTSSITWFAQVKNLTDEVAIANFDPAGARPIMPRTWSSGIRAQF